MKGFEATTRANLLEVSPSENPTTYAIEEENRTPQTIKLKGLQFFQWLSFEKPWRGKKPWKQRSQSTRGRETKLFCTQAVLLETPKHACA